MAPYFNMLRGFFSLESGHNITSCCDLIMVVWILHADCKVLCDYNVISWDGIILCVISHILSFFSLILTTSKFSEF